MRVGADYLIPPSKSTIADRFNPRITGRVVPEQDIIGAAAEEVSYSDDQPPKSPLVKSRATYVTAVQLVAEGAGLIERVMRCATPAGKAS
jgi:hypothetical protein